MKLLLISLIAYCIGSISASYIISKTRFKEDIRTKGSGNAGSTNMLRTYGLIPALMTLVIDIGKGYLAVFIASLFNEPYGIYLAGFMVVIGHCFPMALRFRGGKGVATSGGVLIYHMPLFIPIGLVVFFAMNYAFRLMSLTSIVIALLALVFAIVFYWSNTSLVIMVAALVVLILVRHKDNIKRLIKGEENRISIKKG